MHLLLASPSVLGLRRATAPHTPLTARQFRDRYSHQRRRLCIIIHDARIFNRVMYGGDLCEGIEKWSLEVRWFSWPRNRMNHVVMLCLCRQPMGVHAGCRPRPPRSASTNRSCATASSRLARDKSLLGLRGTKTEALESASPVAKSDATRELAWETCEA